MNTHNLSEVTLGCIHFDDFGFAPASRMQNWLHPKYNKQGTAQLHNVMLSNYFIQLAIALNLFVFLYITSDYIIGSLLLAF